MASEQLEGRVEGEDGLVSVDLSDAVGSES